MHLVWDWNGTLLDDLAIVVDATNAAFTSCGGPTVTVDAHQRGFRRPIADYYAEVLGRPVDAVEFARLDRVFHEGYRAAMARCTLAADAAEALAEWQAAGHTQSLLSMWHHDQLVPFVERLGLAPYFRRVDGLRANSDGGSKARHLVAHLDGLGLAAADCVLVGDTVDDAEAAAAVGAGCVLVTGGFTDADRLRATGSPVVDSLTDAVRLASGAQVDRPRDEVSQSAGRRAPR